MVPDLHRAACTVAAALATFLAVTFFGGVCTSFGGAVLRGAQFSDPPPAANCTAAEADRWNSDLSELAQREWVARCAAQCDQNQETPSETDTPSHSQDACVSGCIRGLSLAKQPFPPQEWYFNPRDPPGLPINLSPRCSACFGSYYGCAVGVCAKEAKTAKQMQACLEEKCIGGSAGFNVCSAGMAAPMAIGPRGRGGGRVEWDEEGGALVVA